MTWPEVLPVLVVAVGVAASLVALVWTLGRIFRPWMRNEVRDGVEALYGRLKANDFKHIEDRMVEGLAGLNRRLDGIEARLDRMERRAEAREVRIVAALSGLGEENDRSPG